VFNGDTAYITLLKQP